ncbi:MAG TPA: hypothetical protein VGS96_18090 [Thermoanaerobaculia bacterium]|jgi:hypothetical protein|nr:hypothetical protein [Thermoanaerobaculia bacterium]
MRLVISILTFATFVMAASAQPLVFKSVGARTPQTSAPKPPPPPPPGLSAAAKAQLLKSLNLTGPGSLYVKLTVRDNYVASRGHLEFGNASLVSSGVNLAAWENPNAANALTILVKGNGPGQRFLIDCAVNSNQEKIPFKLRQGNKLLQSFESNGSAGQHLVFLLETTDDLLNEFTITGAANWYFYSCEITRL